MKHMNEEIEKLKAKLGKLAIVRRIYYYIYNVVEKVRA